MRVILVTTWKHAYFEVIVKFYVHSLNNDTDKMNKRFEPCMVILMCLLPAT